MHDLLHNFLEALQLQIRDELPEIQDQMLKGARTVLLDNTSRIKQWTEKVASGELSRDDADFLIKAQLDLTRLRALEETGLTLARIDQLKKTLVTVLVSSLFTSIQA